MFLFHNRVLQRLACYWGWSCQFVFFGSTVWLPYLLDLFLLILVHVHYLLLLLYILCFWLAGGPTLYVRGEGYSSGFVWSANPLSSLLLQQLAPSLPLQIHTDQNLTNELQCGEQIGFRMWHHTPYLVNGSPMAAHILSSQSYFG
jgi:hypothetical protein